jgi:outer membrane murein-binding lipoprotein Lpp
VAELLAAVSYIKESVDEIKTDVKAMNGKVDAAEKDVAVLQDWRASRNRVDWTERIIASVGIAAAAIFGSQK